MRFYSVFQSNQIFSLVAKLIEGTKILMASVLIARFYGPESFGKYSFVIGVVSIVSIIAEFRLQNVLTQKIAKKEYEEGLLLGSAMTINAFFALIGFLIIGIYVLFESDSVVQICLLIFAVSFFYKIPRSYRAYFVANEKNKSIAICEAASSVFSLVILGACIFFSVDLYMLVFARSLDFLIFSIFIWKIFTKGVVGGFEYRFNLTVAKKLAGLSAPLVLSGVAMIVFQRIDLIMVRQFIGDYAAGIYSAGLNLTIIFSMIPLVISESIAPKMFRMKKDDKSYEDVRQNFMIIVMMVGVIMSALMFVIGGISLQVLYGEEYMAGLMSIKILSLCPLLIALGAAAGQIIVSDENQKGVFLKSVIALGVTIVSNILFIPVMGIEGAAISTVIGLFLANFVLHFFMKRYRYLFRMQCSSISGLIYIKGGHFK